VLRTHRFTVVVTVVGTPEFLEPQVRLLLRWCDDDLDILIVNDARRRPGPSNGWKPRADRAVAHTADQLGIPCLRYPQWRHWSLRRRGSLDQSSIRTVESVSFDFRAAYRWLLQRKDDSEQPSIRTGDAVQFGFRAACRLYPTQPVVILDADMFPFKRFSFSDMLGSAALAGVGQQRGHIQYLWNGLLMFDVARLPELNTIDFSPGLVEGEATDTGGKLYYYLEHHSSLAIGHLNHLKSGRWGRADMPDGLPGPLGNFIDRDPYNECGKFFSEIYEGCLFHLRSGGNWQGSRGFEERAALFLEAIRQI